MLVYKTWKALIRRSYSKLVIESVGSGGKTILGGTSFRFKDVIRAACGVNAL